MSGDYSRWSFDPARHFGAVLMQQGRVHTDADFNESVTALLRRAQADSLDTLGAAMVGQLTPAAFEIAIAGGSLTIGAGRMYVDGLLAENNGTGAPAWDPRMEELRGAQPVPYDEQPYLDAPDPLPAAGKHLVYLKVWRRERTFIEEPELVEPALGVDTGARLQTVWQVKFLPDVHPSITCSTPLEDVPGFEEAEPRAAARLSTGVADVPGEVDPCRVPPSGGYKGLENQLYRVEVHSGGHLSGPGQATFKWSRDNATVASRAVALPALDEVVVESTGRDEVLRFSSGDWVEVTDDARELAGEPGELRRIAAGGVDEDTRTLHLESALPPGAFPVDAAGATTPSRNTRVRKWDQRGRVLDADGQLVVDLDAAGADGTIPVAPGQRQIALEHGVVVSFDLDGPHGTFRAGDHWMFAARTADASVERLSQAPPHAIHAHYASLARVEFPGTVIDCRSQWPPEAGGEDCACTVCVTPASHSSGAMTIQMAVDQVAQTGGTVCLEAGMYPLRKPVELDRARGVRIHGQGSRTVLLGRGRAMVLRRCIDVRIADLVIRSTAGGEPDGALRIADSALVSVDRCLILRPFDGAIAAAAVELDGAVLATTISECVLAGHDGIVGGVYPEVKQRVLAAGLRVEGNWIWARNVGVGLGDRSLCASGTHVVANTIWGAIGGAIRLTGGTMSGGVDIAANVIWCDGPGIVAGVANASIHDNDVTGRPGKEYWWDGIMLWGGLDPDPIDGCAIVGNRVRHVRGRGVGIRRPLEAARISGNTITTTTRGGIVMSEDALAQRLVIDHNQLTGISALDGEQDGVPAAIQAIAVAELEVVDNLIEGVAAAVDRAVERHGVLALACQDVRVAGNRLCELTPAGEFLGPATGIRVAGRFNTAVVDGNRVRRSAVRLKSAVPFCAIAVGMTEATDLFFEAHGNVMALRLDAFPLLLTWTRLRRIPKPHPESKGETAGEIGDATISDNQVDAQATTRPAVLATAFSCQLLGNRVKQRYTDNYGSIVAAPRLAASNNELCCEEQGEKTVLSLLYPDHYERLPPVLGNVTTSVIEVNGDPLQSPWDELNVIVDP